MTFQKKIVWRYLLARNPEQLINFWSKSMKLISNSLLADQSIKRYRSAFYGHYIDK
jgi:hypothetical protein